MVATGSGTLAYQWQRNGKNLPGATESWFTVPTITPADNGAVFRVVVSNAVENVSSTAATLTVTATPPEPTITKQPKSLIVAAGQPATFSVSAAGVPPFRYQWRWNGVNIPGATAASFTVPITAPFDSGATFSTLVSNSRGTVCSTPATLTVTRPPGAPILLTNPDRSRVLVGQSGSFSVRTWSATPVRYQWQRGVFAGQMADIPGATEATYTTPAATLADHHTLFRCLVSNAAGSVASASEMLFVTTEPKPPTEIDSAVCAAAQVGTPFTYTIVSSGGTVPLTYSAEPLPPGLSLDPVSGRIAGIPTQAGNTSVVLCAANNAGHISATLDLRVTTTPPPRSIESWRSAQFGTSAGDSTIAGDTADPDGDGRSNIEESSQESNPLD